MSLPESLVSRPRRLLNTLCASHAALLEGRFCEAAKRSVPGLLAATRVPGAQVAFSIDDRPIRSLSWGVADVSTRAPMTEDTRFAPASLSKPVCAIVALALVQAGGIDLDQSLETYLRDVLTNTGAEPAMAPAWSIEAINAITPRLLLCHAAGLANANPPFASQAPNLCGEGLGPLLRLLAGEQGACGVPKCLHPPGTGVQYSGLGFALLEVGLARHTGRTYASLANELVFAPLALPNTEITDGIQSAKAEAAQHTKEGAAVAKEWPIAVAAQGLLTTARDLVRMFRVAIDSAAGIGKERLLSPRLARLLFTPSAQSSEEGGFALGLHICRNTGGRLFDHSGIRPGMRAALLVAPPAGMVCAILTNGERGEEITDRLSGLFRELVMLRAP